MAKQRRKRQSVTQPSNNVEDVVKAATVEPVVASTPTVRRVVGPGAIPDMPTDVRPSLEGAEADEYVEILNPLSDDFMFAVGVTRTVNAPVRIVQTPGLESAIKTEADLARAGLSGFRNADLGGGRTHIQNRSVIQAGGTIKLPGNEAQVVIKQLVNEIMQREGNKLMLADPHARWEIEQRIIISRRSMADLMGGSGPVSVTDQLKEALARDSATNELAFPDITAASKQTALDAA